MSKKPSIPGNAKALPLKWIYTVKKDLNGNIVQYKATLVVQGFFQIFGVDYTDTYSPEFVSIRIILALCVQLGLIIHTMDVDTAFLNAELEKDIWVKVPEEKHDWQLAMMAYTNWSSRCMVSSTHQDVGTISSMPT